jgi:glutathione synthase/RimK-type ligase-like ATP-grasp enzyme
MLRDMTRWGIIGPPGDEQVARVASYLREHRAEPVILDLSRFPAEATFSLLDGLPVASGLGVGPEGPWYVRSLPLPLPFLPRREGKGTTTEQERESGRRSAYANGRERRSFVFSFIAALERGGALLVNPPSTFGQHFLKLEQLQRLRDAAVPVPRTLATNDPEAVVDFARSVGGPIVYKPLAGGALCRRLTDGDLLPERLRLLAGAPVLFQEEVPGRNLRVYVVAGKVVASYEIVSAELDYRGAEAAVFPAPLGEEEHDACLRAAEACEMVFTGIDIRRRDDGTFALLECNPSPMFAAIERRTGESGVTRALGELLLGSMEPRPPG